MRLLHFSADWCQPCKKMVPIVDQFLEQNPGIYYNKVDIEEEFDTAQYYNVMAIPTFIAVSDNEILGRHTGLANLEKLKSLFDKVV